MFRLAAIILLTSLLYWCAQAQAPDNLSENFTQGFSSLDTLLQETALCNSVGQKQFETLDSIKTNTKESFDKLKHSYDSIASIADNATSRTQQRIDSLTKFNLPSNQLTSKLDSITQWKDEKLKAIESKVDELKSSVNEKIQSLAPINIGVPDELKEKSQELTSAVNKLDVNLPNASLPETNIGSDLSSAIPSLENPLVENLPGQVLPDVNNALSDVVPDIDIPSANQITDVVPKNMDEVTAAIEKEAGNAVGLDAVQKQIGEAGQLQDISQLQDEKAMKEKLKEEAKKQAINHFAGKEHQLQQATEQMAKYKKKYESVQSLAELPEKKTNPLRDKPFIERFVPGIALQTHRKDAWMMDFNPYAGYRFNPHLTAGLGWNQRIAYKFDVKEFQHQHQIFGPRIYSEYKIGKGFSGRLEAEYMKTIVPSLFSSGQTDENGREWVFSTFAGLKKDYHFIGKVKGTMMIMYNLYDPDHRSPYKEKLNMRFGFEFPFKAKSKN